MRTKFTTTEPREFVREYRGGVVRCYPAVNEFYAEFDGQPIGCCQPSEVMAQRLIDDYRLDQIERGLLDPTQDDLDRFEAETLIAAAGGPHANPFTVRERDGELQVIDRRTGALVDSCDRFDARAHTMSAQPRRLWLAELRAAQRPDDDPEPTPPGGARVLWRWQGTAAALQTMIAQRPAA